MAKYFEATDHVIDNDTGAFIPRDAGNREYRKYQAWVADSNTPDTQSASEILTEAKAAAVGRVKDSGFNRVHAVFKPHVQARLAFKGATDTQRVACRDLIEAVKVEVDTTEAAILAATTPAEVETAEAALNLPE